MADPTPHWVHILDEVDEATRHAIIETQLEGLDAPTDPCDPDTLLAREVFSIELKRYRGTRPHAPASEPAQSEVPNDIRGQATEQRKSVAHLQANLSVLMMRQMARVFRLRSASSGLSGGSPRSVALLRSGGGSRSVTLMHQHRQVNTFRAAAPSSVLPRLLWKTATSVRSASSMENMEKERHSQVSPHLRFSALYAVTKPNTKTATTFARFLVSTGTVMIVYSASLTLYLRMKAYFRLVAAKSLSNIPPSNRIFQKS